MQSPPFLSLTPFGNQEAISWASYYTAFALQQNLDLATTNWSTMTNQVTPTNGLNRVVVSPGPGQNFFRLKSL